MAAVVRRRPAGAGVRAASRLRYSSGEPTWSRTPLSSTHRSRICRSSAGQGSRRLRGRRRAPADRRDRSHLRLRLRAGSGIPDKGRVLTQLSAFWFERIARSRAASSGRRPTSRDFPPRCAPHADVLRGRSMLVRRTDAARRSSASRAAISPARAGRTIARPARCAASRCRRVCARAIGCPRRSSRRRPRRRAGTTRTSPKRRPPRSSATRAAPALKALTLDALRARRGARRVARHHPRRHEVRVRRWPTHDGDDAESILIDEVMTPDSSRFWPADTTRPGGPQPSFDKQFVRDYLEAIRWNKQPPVPSLPDDVVARTREKYLDAFRRLTGPGAGVTDARATRRPRPRDGGQGHPLRRRRARIRAALHQRARSKRRTATSAAPPSGSACTATPSAAKSTNTGSRSRELTLDGFQLPAPDLERPGTPELANSQAGPRAAAAGSLRGWKCLGSWRLGVGSSRRASVARSPA